MPRFYAPGVERVGAPVALPEEEAHHLRHVLRLDVGARVSVFDGRGGEYVAAVDRVSRQAVIVRPLEATPSAPEASVAVTLAPAVLKGRAFDGVVRDAVMLGVVAVQPLLVAQLAVHGPTVRRPGGVARWRRIAVSAAKQSGRAVVPVVHDAVDATRFAAGDRSALSLVLAEPAAGREAIRLRTLAAARPATIAVAVGPEGGWTPAEIHAFTQHGFQPVTLGGRTLRAETVPIATLAALLCLWDET